MAKMSLKQLAQKELAKSPLIAGFEKLDTEDILNQPVTAIAFDIATARDSETGEEKTYPVFLLKEYEGKYYSGGYLLNKMVQCWMAEYEDVEEASKALAEEGGLTFIVRPKPKGKQYYPIDIV